MSRQRVIPVQIEVTVVACNLFRIILKICLFVLTECTNVTDRHTYR